MAIGPGGKPIIENPHAPDVYADNAVSYTVLNGVLRISLTSYRPVETGGESAHVIIARLNMPVVGAQALTIGLFDFLKAQGLDPTLLVSRDQTAN